MAIKIIKEGKVKKFTKICPDCDCEFEYEQEDIKVDYSICLTSYPCKYNTYVVCPCCGKHLHHGYTDTELPFPNYPNIIYTGNKTDIKSDTFELNCDTCPNKPNPNKPIFGDSPCTWCVKRQATCK